MSTEKVAAEEVQEDAVLESLGYRQELKRSFGLLGMIGFSFSIVTSWSALGGTLIIGVESGGPPVMIYSWIGISVFALAVAYSMAEICSAYPVAGGQYSWVAVLAPPSVARGMSYVTGWFMITGMGCPSEARAHLICSRHHRNGCDSQLHRRELHPWPSQPILPSLHYRALAYGPPRILDRLDRHRYQPIWAASPG